MEAIPGESQVDERACFATRRNQEDRVLKPSAEILQRLASALKKETSDVQKDYKSGAVYRGQVANNKRCGHGLFAWPDGTRYEGEFVDNSRHGLGVQSWPDGSYYDGSFLNDAKHGSGFHLWSNGETYEGKFFKDRCHGPGVYSWPNRAQYNGTFYIDKKEGYGTFTFTSGARFEGLYKCDTRTGPGVLTYPDERQDVGLWLRERIIKLCFPVENAFALKNCKDYEDYVDENRKCVPVEGIYSRHDLIRAILGVTPELFDYDTNLSASDFAKELLLDTLPVGCLAADLVAYDEEFFESSLSVKNEKQELNENSCKLQTECDLVGLESLNSKTDEVGDKIRIESSSALSLDTTITLPTNDLVHSAGSLSDARYLSKDSSAAQSQQEIRDDNEDVLAWNNTPSCMRIQAHVLRHQNQQKTVDFDIDAVLSGSRGRHEKRGPIEIVSEQFLLLAADNNLGALKSILHNGDVDVDVADVNGHTALIGATINMHDDVINCLLDNGADVNKLNDEGMSPLAVSFLFLYPPSFFKSVNDEMKSSDDGKVLKRNIVSGKSRKKKAKVEKTDAKRIQELKEEVGKARSQISDMQSMISMNEESVKSSPVPEDRKLGTLYVRRVDKTDPETILTLNPIADLVFNEANEIVDIKSNQSESGISDFDSHRIVRNLPINVPNEQIVKYAEILSSNEMVIGRMRSADILSEGTVRCLAVEKSKRQRLRETMKLLLKRGADPNASSVPMPVLFFAVRSGDVEAVQFLLAKGAVAGAKLSPKFDGLSPLHYACLLPGEDGVRIVKDLLNALADPDARAQPDESYLNHYLEEEWTKDNISPRSANRLGGRTPLHIACSRSDNFELASNMVRLLMDHRADTGLLCNGHSALSLAITSGNDLAVDELLRLNINASLPLTHGIGSALCASTLTANESKRKPDDRITLINKLVNAGANMFTPVAVGPKRQIGTVVDYAFYMYSLDRKIANVPYHALAPADRETFNARKRLLEHLGHLQRQKAVERETKRFQTEDELGVQKQNPSANFVYTGCGSRLADAQLSRVKSGRRPESVPSEDDIRRPSFHFCYECGRSVGVRLEPCSRCKSVFYCSKPCQNKAWAEVHKDECLRVPGMEGKKTPSATQKGKRGLRSEDLKRVDAAGVGGMASWKNGLPSNCHIGNYSYI